MRAFDKSSDPNLMKRTLDAGLSSVPGLSVAWALCKALYGNALELRQQKALEWVEMVRDNPGVFREQLLKSTDFQDGFIVALENYLKIRTVLKRGMARKIFIGFAQSKDKENFELERYNTTLNQISAASLEFLAYIKEYVEPRQRERIIETLDSIDFDSSPIEKIQAEVYIKRQNPLSHSYKDIRIDSGTQIMLPNKPNPRYPTISGSMGVTIPNSTQVVHAECLAELVNLGVLTRSRYTTPVSNTDSTTVYHDLWDYTLYGKEFIAYLEQ